MAPKQDPARRVPITRLEFQTLIDSLRCAPIGPDQGRRIGVGGFAGVNVITDPVTWQQFAVKSISRKIDPTSLEREVDILARLQHPCIVRILGWSPGTDSSDGQIRLEYAAKGALSAILWSCQKPALWTATQIGIIICDIVLGMRYVHSQGILHLDLKPDNILLDGNLRVKICDFGLSRFVNIEESATSATGTVGYLSPEHLLDDFRPTTKTDVFTFGVVLYELISGKRAFPGNEPFRFLRLLREQHRPSVPDEFGPLMQKLIPRCLSERPRNRPSFQQISREFEADGFALLPGADGAVIREAVLRVLDLEANSEPIQSMSTH
jgi:serine/threonine protein kinase